MFRWRLGRSFTLLFLLLAVVWPGSSVADQTLIYQETFESGGGSWSASNGSWQVGDPVGGTEAHGGTMCAATNLTGYYARYANSRFESPAIALPADPQDGQIWLRFWQWFSFSSSEGDYGRVEVSVNNGAWQVAGDTFYTSSGNWTVYIVDLSAHAGQSVRLGFHLVDAVDSTPAESWGWYVDDLEIVAGAFPSLLSDGFEGPRSTVGYGGWYADHGVWEVGTPSAGPSGAGTGRYCAGTVLTGYYPRYANSRLVSPTVQLPATPIGGRLWLSFMHWYDFSASEYDYGRVEVLHDGVWTALSGYFDQYSGGWTERILDLSAYSGESVRFGFHLVDAVDSVPAEASGWFVDDVAVVEGPLVFNNPDGFEGGSRGWSPTNGVWQLGAPTSGPGAAHGGNLCWGTVLAGNYPRYADSELLSSPVTLPSSPGGLALRLWHWFSFSASEGDYGVVRIHPQGGAVAELSARLYVSSGGWTQANLNLDAYAGQTVQIGFLIADAVDSTPGEAAGWYVDDVELIGMPQSSPATLAPNVFGTAYSSGAPLLQWHYLPFDPQYVAVYASRAQSFVPNLGNRIALLTDDATSYLDSLRPGYSFFYQVSFIDDLGHESMPATCGPPYTAVTDPTPGLSGVRPVELHSAFPNPFNPATRISFDLARPADVTLQVYDVAGRKVAELLRARLEAGRHDVPFDGRDLASGLYFARLEAQGEVLTGKMLLVK